MFNCWAWLEPYVKPIASRAKTVMDWPWLVRSTMRPPYLGVRLFPRRTLRLRPDPLAQLRHASPNVRQVIAIPFGNLLSLGQQPARFGDVPPVKFLGSQFAERLNHPRVTRANTAANINGLADQCLSPLGVSGGLIR